MRETPFRQRFDVAFGRLMHLFSAGPANFQYTTKLQLMLTSLVDEVCGTLARLCAYVMTLALFAILGIGLWNALPEMIPAEPVRSGWNLAERSARAFAVSQANLHDKTEAYAVFRHPEGGRKDTFQWSGAGKSAVAELEIYRQGSEFEPATPSAADIAARMDPSGGPQEFESAGVVDSKFGTVALLRLTGDTEPARACLGFIKQIDDPALRLSGWSCLGDSLPARRAAVGCMLNRLILLTAGNDAKLAELFARAELRRPDCGASGATALSADWITGADNPRLRGTF